MILLVYHEEETRNYIRNMGVDVSTWKIGLSTLLHPDNRQSPDSHRHPDSRSQSPHRSPMSYSSPSRQHNSSSRMSSTANFKRRTYAPVYLVDVRQLYMRLMQVNSERLIEIISTFGLGSADGWCAGNEAVYVLKFSVSNSYLINFFT